jgi:hypothetical protein
MGWMDEWMEFLVLNAKFLSHHPITRPPLTSLLLHPHPSLTLISHSYPLLTTNNQQLTATLAPQYSIFQVGYSISNVD